MRKKTTLAIVVLMIMNLLPVAWGVALPEGALTVNGSRVIIDLPPEEGGYRTVVIEDGSGSRRYVDQSDTGRFETVMEPGSYTLRVNGYDDVPLTVGGVSIAVLGSKVTVKGSAKNAGAVTAVVTDGSGSRVYVDQVAVGGASGPDGGYPYEFVFSLKPGAYTLKVKPSSEDMIVQSFTVGDTGEVSYALSPVSGSRDQLYSVPMYVEFAEDVKVAPLPKEGEAPVQVTLTGTKIDGTPDNDRVESSYVKSFTDVLTVDENNPKRVNIDLGRQGERLDVDFAYTVAIAEGALQKASDDASLIVGQEWTFDTHWTGVDVSKLNPEAVANIGMESANGFNGLFIGQNKGVGGRVYYLSGGIKYADYPIEWYSTDAGVATVDRNGVVTGVSAGNCAIVMWLPQAGSNDLNPWYINLEVKDNVNRRMQLVGRAETNSAGAYAVSDSGNLYVARPGGIAVYDGSMNASSIECDGSLYGVHTIGGVEYAAMYDGNTNTVSLVNSSTGQVWRSGIAAWQMTVESKAVYSLQAEKDSSKLILNSSSSMSMYDAEEDETVWSRSNRGFSEYNVDDGTVYLAEGRYMTAVDGATGHELWSVDVYGETGADEVSNPKAGENAVYATVQYESSGSKHGVVAFDKRTGSILWVSERYAAVSSTLAEASAGVVVFAKAESNHDNALIAADIATGEVKELRGGFRYNVFGSIVDIYAAIYGCDRNGYMYTQNGIFDGTNPIAYPDISFDGYAFSVGASDMSLSGGYVYRVVMDDGGNNYVEKLQLIDEYAPVASGIKADSSMRIYEGEEESIGASIVDQFGFAMAGNLSYSLSPATNDDVLSLKNGKLKAVKLPEEVTDRGDVTADFTVTVTSEDYPDLSADISVKMMEKSKPTALYAVMEKLNRTGIRHISEFTVIEDVSTKVGAQVGGFQVFVADQHGELMRDQMISYKHGDESIVGALLYQDVGDVYEHKYQCVYIGKKAGLTSTEVWLPNNPEVEHINVNVQVEDINYTILWEIPTEGPWGGKRAAHTMGISNDFIYSNENYITAVDKIDGSRLWQSDAGVYYGMQIGHPMCDEAGVIYAFDKMGTGVLAVDSMDEGRKLWGASYGTSPVKMMDVATEYVYVLNYDGEIYCLSKADGSIVWSADMGASDMEVSPEGKVYVVTGNSISSLAANGHVSSSFTVSGADSIDIRALSDTGMLLVEAASDRKYSAVCMDASGSVKWSRAVNAAFTARWDGDSAYIWARGTETTITAVDREGATMFGPTELDNGMDIQIDLDSFPAERRPIIKNGRLYVYPQSTYCFDAATGEMLWNCYIRDTFSGGDVATMTVDSNGVVYAATGARGMFAYTVKGFKADSFGIDLSGRPALTNGSAAVISVTAANNTASDYDEVVLSAELEDAATGKVVSSWAVKSSYYGTGADDEGNPVREGQMRSYTFGLRVPEEGSFRLVIKATAGGETLDTFELSPAAGRQVEK